MTTKDYLNQNPVHISLLSAFCEAKLKLKLSSFGKWESKKESASLSYF